MIDTRTLVALTFAVACLSCTSGDDGANDTGDGASTAASTTTASTTTTTDPPIVRGLGESLGLAPGQCYDDVPETTTTTATTTSAPPTSEGDTTSTAAAAPTTEPPPITVTIPRPPLVAIVECAGTNRGVVFASFCVGSLVEPPELIDLPSELGESPCPGDA